MKLLTDLYPWQRAAVDKLLPIRVGALYMEMGTGKTRTALEMIRRRLDAGKIAHALWLCPCSVRENLRQDIRKHADGALANIAIYGIESLSSSLRLYELLGRFVAAAPTMLIVDESNLVKNHRAIRTERVTRLAASCKYRMILNGTPISRNEADLFSQWYILDWRILGYRSFWSFAANHLEYDPEIKGKVRRTLNTDYLIEKIAPYSYQVSMADCWKLPGKRYGVEHCSLTDAQGAHYDEITEKMIAQLDEQRPATIYRMFAAAQAIISGLWVEDDGRHMKTRPMFPNPPDNPRMQALLKILEAVEGQAIIFAKYTHEIQGILDTLPDAAPFYGGLNAARRQAALENFRAGRARFLVANKACAGYGLNLQFCRRVIYYSNDWDWATRIQSEDRVYRLGQDREVEITDIVAPGTLDQKIMRCLARKERLEDAIKRELKAGNGVREARGKFRAWVRGEMEDGIGEALSGPGCVPGGHGAAGVYLPGI
ncbi:MAG: DEAD/DEAH box helicase [Deltaproteobacteria bacterium]|nr:DEAD/DEAH box helicase [Deltaproteobacteria bacterium]